jgi:C-terminal peptidase prc
LDDCIKKIVLLFSIFVFLNLGAYAAGDEAYDRCYGNNRQKLCFRNQSKNLTVGAIKGIVDSLDPFSQYMEEKAFKDMKNETEGAYSGVGLRIMSKNNFITVVSPLHGTPAYRAGILPNDRIIKIDGKSTNKMNTDEAVELMRGKTGKKLNSPFPEAILQTN